MTALKSSSRPQNSGASKRMQKFAHDIRSCVAMMLINGEIADPRLRGTTIHHVKMSPDLKLAKIYFASTAEQADEIKDLLNQAAGFFRKQLSRELKVQFMPKFVFYYDDSLDYTLKMRKILAQVAEEKSS